MSDMVDGFAYCEHVQQTTSNVTGCSVWCRHYPGGSRDGVVCPHAERQCVADHGPAPFLPTEVESIAAPAPSRPLLPAEVAGSLGAFGTAADHGFANIVRPTYAQRGEQYGDTWALDELYDEVDRLTDANALVRVKCRRHIGTRGTHRDSVVDLIAYASAYLAWGDACEGWWD